MHTAEDVARLFEAKFGEKAKIFRAPGRVNLIGEHTDYNQGFVMPAAVDLSCWVGVSARKDRRLVVHSNNFGEAVEVELGKTAEWPRKGWASYPLGVAWALEDAGHRLEGCNLEIVGDVPLGSGLSSSAAIEVATALALLGNSGGEMDRKSLALLCQRAENEFVGARCGIMDQFIACHGRANHAVLLDCRSLEGRLIPVPANVALVVCNTMVRHELAANEYNKRRAECEEGVRLLKERVPGIESLRDVSVAELEEHGPAMPRVVYRRCRHVVTENVRAVEAADAFEKGDLQTVGRLMAASHESLRDDYQVSCVELDAMVESARGKKGVRGARMTGGGFGGCTVNLVELESVEEFRGVVAKEYEMRTGLRAEIYSLKAADGAGGV